MLTRLAACFLSLTLSVSATSASGFARPPQGPVAAAEIDSRDSRPNPAAMPMPVAPDRAEVRKALAKRRTKNLASFRAYRKGGVYPHNTWRQGPLNVWRDMSGHLCAAATMIDMDGKHDLVQQVAENTNFLRLLDVTEGPALDWMLTSGFTIEEIDRIQEPGFMEQQQVTIATLRKEDARLAKDYAATDKWLVAHARKALDTATDRLMNNPWLARQLVEGTL